MLRSCSRNPWPGNGVQHSSGSPDHTAKDGCLISCKTYRDESAGIFPYSQGHDDSPSTRRLSRDRVGACSQVFKDWSCLASILTHYSLNADTRGYFP
eukprot:sb/3478963/